MNSLDYIKNKWCYSICNDIGSGETQEDIAIDINHPYIFEKPILGQNNIDDLITFIYKDDNKQDFYCFECSKGIIIYYKQYFKKID